MKNTLEYARKYCREGWRLIPIPQGEKAPVIRKWQELRIKSSRLAHYFDEDPNIGVLLGEPSNNLIDIDLDCNEAIALANNFLPHTDRVHGRKSKPESHRWYYARSPIKTMKFEFRGKCLLEIRSTGGQTVLPPSIHPSGQRVRWTKYGKVKKVGSEKLLGAVRRLAAATLLVRHYPAKGSRNDFVLALAGMLQRADWEELEIEDFIAAIARTSDDEEWASRKAAARSTRKRMESGGPATGRPRLSKLIGTKVVDQVCRWLDISDLSPLITRNTTQSDWPKPLSQATYRGVVGKIMNIIEPKTEADPAAILIQLIVALGNCIGPGPFYYADGARQRANMFCLLVGQTSKARKGTALKHVLNLIEMVDRKWASERIIHGLSSGEGLINAVRDPIVKEKNKDKIEIIDPGIKDKRALVCEGEFSSVLRNQRRQGNNLSAIMRLAWDGGNLQTLTKNSPLKATAPHVSVIAHVTQEELRRELTITDQANGYANRFLIVCAKRSRELPLGGKIDPRIFLSFASKLRQAVKTARCLQEVKLSRKAEKLWCDRYSELSAARPGMIGAIISRAETHVLRLALIYALLDKQKEIKTQHLRAALEIWRYCRESAQFIFGNSLGDDLADRILRHLNQASEGLSRNEIREALGRNYDENRTNIALDVLERENLANRVSEKTAGRPAERWYAALRRHKRLKRP